jgi:8-oxo-dGTP pyrophosphatase MutT (NUDIX family)
MVKATLGQQALVRAAPDQAALRELREEAGLDGEPCGMVSVRTRVTEEGGAVFVEFCICCDSGEPALDGYEVDAALFFNPEELPALNPVMKISRQIALAVLAAPGVELVETDIPECGALSFCVWVSLPKSAGSVLDDVRVILWRIHIT